MFFIRGVSQTPFNLPGNPSYFMPTWQCCSIFRLIPVQSTSTLEVVEGVEVGNLVLQTLSNVILVVSRNLGDAQIYGKLNEFLQFVYIITSFELLLPSVKPGELGELLLAKPKPYGAGLGSGGNLALYVGYTVHASLFISM